MRDSIITLHSEKTFVIYQVGLQYNKYGCTFTYYINLQRMTFMTCTYGLLVSHYYHNVSNTHILNMFVCVYVCAGLDDG